LYVVIDFLTLIPTTSLPTNKTLVAGSDILQLFRHYRNWAIENNIMLITPMQASTTAADLGSEGYEAHEYAKMIAKRNLTALSRQVIQVLDKAIAISSTENKRIMAVYLYKNKGANITSGRNDIFMHYTDDGVLLPDGDNEKPTTFFDYERAVKALEVLEELQLVA